MGNDPRAELELVIRRHCDEKDFDGAVSAALRGYGPEVFDLLRSMHHNEDDAGEAYAEFAKGLWCGVERFRWECSFRTWAYLIARRTSMHHRRATRRRAALNTPLPAGSQVSVLVAEARSRTVSHLAAHRRTRLMELRESLSPEDQTLLVLRVDRELAWKDLARVLHDGPDALDADELQSSLCGAALDREAARLRQRFQALKQKLNQLGQKEGLVSAKKNDK